MQKDAQRLLEAAATAKPLLPGGKPPNVKPNNSAAPPPASVPGGFWDRLNAGKSGTAPPPVLPSPAPTPAVIAPAATPPLSTVSTALPAGVPVTGEAAIDEDEDLMNEILEEAQ